MSISGCTKDNVGAMKHPTRTVKWNLICAAAEGSLKIITVYSACLSYRTKQFQRNRICH